MLTNLLIICFILHRAMINNNNFKHIIYRVNHFTRSNNIISIRNLCNKNNNQNSFECIETIATRLWVEKFVFRYGLCPWSGKLIAGNSNKLKIIAIDSLYQNPRLKLISFKNIMNEIELLIKGIENPSGSKYPESTMIVIKDLKDFKVYLNIIEKLERLLTRKGYDKYIQVASFHPNYIFSNTKIDSEENWTNRTPYPTIHLLRVIDVTKAIESYNNGNTDNIWKNNIIAMRQLGNEKLIDITNEIINEATRFLDQNKS